MLRCGWRVEKHALPPIANRINVLDRSENDFEALAPAHPLPGFRVIRYTRRRRDHNRLFL